MKRIRVFVLDSQELIRHGVAAVLDGTVSMQIVGEAGTADPGTARILALRPDVVVLDTCLPDGSGIEVCRTIRSRDPGIHVLALNARDDDEALFESIAAGASGFLLKSVTGRDLVDAIYRVAHGQSLVDPALTARVFDRLRFGSCPPAALHRLSVRESDVLRFVAEGLTNKQIAEQMHLAEKTIKTYVSSMLAKLGLRSRVQAAILATQLFAQAERGPSQPLGGVRVITPFDEPVPLAALA